MEACLAGAGTADNQHVLVDVVFWYLIPPKHNPLRLCQEDIVVKLRVDKRLDVLLRPP